MFEHRGIARALAAAGVLACSISAFAADMPVKAPPPAVSLWTGFYVGGNGGYSWGKANTDVGVPAFIVAGATIPGRAFSDSNNLKGVIGGGQFGYNVQTGSLVLGLEVDFQASGEKGGGATRTDPFDVTAFGVPFTTQVTGTATTQYDAKISWFGTARWRVGLATNGILLYGTGGLAYGRVQVNGSNTVNGTSTDCILAVFCFPATPVAAVTSVNGSRVNGGWTAGAGIEAALGANWSWKLEYLYLDLGSLYVATTTPFGTVITTHTRFTDHIVRLGLNVRFNSI